MKKKHKKNKRGLKKRRLKYLAENEDKEEKLDVDALEFNRKNWGIPNWGLD